MFTLKKLNNRDYSERDWFNEEGKIFSDIFAEKSFTEKIFDEKKELFLFVYLKCCALAKAVGGNSRILHEFADLFEVGDELH
jgi:hypothetical protein